MKKVLLSIALVMAMVFGANAQDSWIPSYNDDLINRDGAPITPGLPGEHGLEGDQTAPLGSGLLILTALGAGYALRKRN